MHKDIFKYLLWVISATFWTLLCFILPDCWNNPTEGLYGIIMQIVFLSIYGIGAFFALYAIGSSRFLNAIILPLWGILGAVLSFYRIGYHISLTPTLIDVTLHTNHEEALGVLSWQLLLWIAVNLSIAIGLVWIRHIKIHLTHGWIHSIVSILLGSLFLFGNTRLHASLCHHFPYNIPYVIHAYTALQHNIHEERSIPPYISTEVPDSINVVLVLGEAVRADHLQLNGYTRETTPLLAQRENVVSMPHIYSEQTHTAASLPYILTRADSLHELYQYNETSFASIFRQEDFYTAWISNQDMGPSFAHFPNECDTFVFANAGKSVYDYSQWLDQDLVRITNAMQLQHKGRSLYIIHPIGSHWYYNNHVPKNMNFFVPITTNRLITANSVEQIINSYDNTIRYMDFILDSLISCFQDKCAIIIYQSDHGESLGENGVFLHANDTEEAKHPACIIWYSNAYAAIYPDKIKALIANKDKRYRTDYVFYSILYAVGILTNEEPSEMNIFR